jgi:Phage integrase family
MLRADLDEARVAWLDTFRDPQERIERDSSDFLRSVDSEEERLDFHALRHTTASWLIQSGADLKTVQTIMRHSDIRLTVDRYGHLFPGSEAAAIAKMRGVFSKPCQLRKTGTSDQDSTHQHCHQQLGNETMRKPTVSGVVKCEEVVSQEVASENANPLVFLGLDQEKQGDSCERLRSDLNRRWRICNPLP